MTVTTSQIAKAKATGLKNVDAIAAAANKTGCPFYLAAAMIQRESNGKNVYGHDAGGALAGFPEEVSLGNWDVFRWLVFEKGQTSNGVGPAQLTYKGFFTDMEKQGLKPYQAPDNILYGVRLLFSYYKNARKSLGVRDSIKEAGTKYNGAAAYGDGLLKMALEWKDRVGSGDYA